MYNSDFWEVQIDQENLESFPNEASPFYETDRDRRDRYLREDLVDEIVIKIYQDLSDILTLKQFEVVILYYIYQKTQQDIATILGISRRVVSQHLHGICRNGKYVGGAVKKIRKLFEGHELVFNTRHQIEGRSLGQR